MIFIIWQRLLFQRTVKVRQEQPALFFEVNILVLKMLKIILSKGSQSMIMFTSKFASG